MHENNKGAAPTAPGSLRPKKILAVAGLAMGGVLWMDASQAMRFGSEESGVSGSFDSTLSVGFSSRLESPDCHLLGNDSGGCNTGANTGLGKYYNPASGTGYANADINFSNSDDGDLNYAKHDLYSEVIKGSHELSLKFGDGWSALGRVSWAKDFKMDNTRLTDLDHDAEREATERFDLLDLWLAKSFDLGRMPAKAKVGNQVISWGEEIFIPGGINQINALNLTNYHTPGTELKEVFIPAPIASFTLGTSDHTSVEAYYQLKWNSYELDPVGTYFSTVDIVGKGHQPIYFPTSVVEGIYGAGVCSVLTPTGKCGAPQVSGLDKASLIAAGLAVPYAGEKDAKDGGQYGIALRWTVEQIDTEFGAFYERYHDKVPFVGYTGDRQGNVTSYFVDYGEDKNLFGLSMSTQLGPVAVAAELSYRPEDSVGVDPTVPYGSIGGGAFDRNSVYDVGRHKGFVEEKKWQFDVNGIYTFSANDPLGFVPSLLHAEDAFLLAEAAAAHYPNLKTDGSVPYLLPDYSLPDRTSWGYVLETGVNYPNVFGTGITLTPQLDYSQDVNGTAPNAMPFVEGRKSLTSSLLFNYRDRWRGGLQWVQYWGGGDNNLVSDRDFLSGSISYSF